MSTNRKTSTVVFYQPDEDDVITRPGDCNISDSKSNASKLRILGRKSTESEDSGVRSNEDDDGRRRSRRFSLRRFSRASVCSTPLFDFPTFDELFETGGETKLVLHRSSTATSDIFPRSATSPSLDKLRLRADTLVTIWHQRQGTGTPPTNEHAQEFSGDGGTNCGDVDSVISDGVRFLPWITKMNCDGGSASETQSVRVDDEMETMSGNHRPTVQRHDSIMFLPLSTLIVKSYEGSNGFAGFRNRLGNNILHKYCMCCRFDSMPLVFLHVLFGMFIFSAGVLSLVHCFDEVMINVYMLADGLLSVFLFPILIMNWTKRVGGCISENEKEKLGNGVFWTFVVVFRFLTSLAGTAVVMYRKYYQEQIWASVYCETVNLGTYYIVIAEWALVIVLLIIPMIIYGIVYCFAPCCQDDVD